MAVHPNSRIILITNMNVNPSKRVNIISTGNKIVTMIDKNLQHLIIARSLLALPTTLKSRLTR
jgi:hypothetical protein